LDIALLENAIATVFASKGSDIVEMNKRALAIGVENSK
jgi:Pyruvate/2-oxoacid:ferredoxin oxidoreductase gamma subunit